MRFSTRLLLIGLLAATSARAEIDYGFGGPEIFPIDFMISFLKSADVNGDGKKDLVVVNNARSRINILYNQTGETNRESKGRGFRGRNLNELPPDSRFRIESLTSDKRISALVVADLNHDSHPDIVSYGDSHELSVQYNLGKEGWSVPRKWSVPDGQMTPYGLVEGDLNGNGRMDLLLLGEQNIYWFEQGTEQTLREPTKIPFSGKINGVQILDVDGDGRQDLFMAAWEGTTPFRFRLQNKEGGLGPEIHLTLPKIRSYWAGDLDGDHVLDLVVVSELSGRAQLYHLQRKKGEALGGEFSEGQFQVQPFNATSKNRRGAGWIDLNGDGRADLVVAEPESGQLTWYAQENGGLGAARVVSTLTGITELDSGDLDGDGKPELYVLSPDERQFGRCRIDDKGNIPFPESIPVNGKPLSFAIGRLKKEGPPVAALIVETDKEKQLVIRDSKAVIHTHKFNELKGEPQKIVFHDVNQDGRPDLVVLVPYEKLKFLIQKEAGGFDEVDLAPPGGGSDQPWIGQADVDGDGKSELLLPQKNFLRAVVVSESAGQEGGSRWGFKIKEQINGAGNNSRLTGATAVANGTNVSLFLLDAERKVVTMVEKDKAGTWQIVRNIQVPAVGFNQLDAIKIGDRAGRAVGFLGTTMAAWLQLQGETWELAEVDGYETPVRNARIHDVLTGDFNRDGRKELIFLESTFSFVDIVRFDPPGKLVAGDRWRVFEERTYRQNVRGEIPEPREALVDDFTGDGKNDIVVVVHDRILLYPQE